MFPADRGQNVTDSGQYDNVEYVFGASGAAPLYRRRMLEDIEMDGDFFDEDYRIYVEDVDLCWRAQLSGWKTLYTPRAIAHHKRGATREKNSRMLKEYILVGHRNRYWSIIKNAFVSSLIKNFLWILLVEWRFYLGHLLKENYFIIKTIPMVFSGMPRMLQKRRAIQRRKKVSVDYMDAFLFEEMKRTIKGGMVKRLRRMA
jgi:GT2 family glycosyltransferase